MKQFLAMAGSRRDHHVNPDALPDWQMFLILIGFLIVCAIVLWCWDEYL